MGASRFATEMGASRFAREQAVPWLTMPPSTPVSPMKLSCQNAVRSFLYCTRSWNLPIKNTRPVINILQNINEFSQPQLCACAVSACVCVHVCVYVYLCVCEHKIFSLSYSHCFEQCVCISVRMWTKTLTFACSFGFSVFEGKKKRVCKKRWL